MESVGVPLVALIRSLGPPLVVLAVGAVLLVRRRPVRARLMWTALAVQLAAAALPYAWLVLQAAAGLGRQNAVGLAMILVQPAVEALAWMLALAAVTAIAPRGGTARQDPSAAVRPLDAPAPLPACADRGWDADAKVPRAQQHNDAVGAQETNRPPPTRRTGSPRPPTG
ncbi:hypothetical protein [Streptomonospora wellingtoniae]|uniref:Uncharacterized protein n=1 Tax=Streptomonospora wellingtoniae TaxID=3075544 RepID=A0ABU2KW65_9ACTN|nr:hypothetical protein [Streptomonospora sp. DSM 45055]MDT0303535.1 hypothetical protein [Streptomonospora sp. DSM 45055]